MTALFSLFLSLLAAPVAELPVDRAIDWWQWGGPTRDFRASAPALAARWRGEQVPAELFRRQLLGGHSAIAYGAGRLFIVHGKDRTEKVLALSPLGEKLWEREIEVGYDASIESHDGPHSAPLVLDGALITIAIDATVRAWRAEDGSLLWMRDLRRDHGVTLPQAGYAASPLLVDGAVLIPGLGGDGPGLRRTEAPNLGILKLDAQTGETVWAKESFPSSHASAILVRARGRSLAIFHGMEVLVAVDSVSGELIWKFPIRNGAADNVSFTPIWEEESRTLIVSHAYDRWGAQGIRLDARGGSPERVWSNPRLKVEHGNGVLWEGMLIASDGSAPGFLVALDAETGKLLWKERLPKANLIRVADQMVLVLDSDGTLHLAHPTRDGSGVVSRFEVLDELSWTAPTLVGRTLYLRDPTTAVALRLP